MRNKTNIQDTGPIEGQIQRMRAVGVANFTKWDGSLAHGFVLRGVIDAKSYQEFLWFSKIYRRYLRLIGAKRLQLSNGWKVSGSSRGNAVEQAEAEDHNEVRKNQLVRRRISSGYPDYKQRNAALELYSAAKVEAIKADIQAIRTRSDEMEASLRSYNLDALVVFDAKDNKHWL